MDHDRHDGRIAEGEELTDDIGYALFVKESIENRALR